MKKAFLLLLLLLSIGAGAAVAQEANTVTIRFPGAPSGGCAPLSFGINSANGDLYDCVAGVYTKVGSSGGGGTPAGATSAIQNNAGGGAFGSVNQLTSNVADCDGFGDPCDIFVTGTSTFAYFIAGTNTSGTAGNYFDFYQFTDGGLFMDASKDGTHAAELTLDENSDSGISDFSTNGGIQLSLHTGFESSIVSRYMFSTHASQVPVAGDFALSAGWGNTGAVSAVRGSDNVWDITVTPGGTGIAATPTVTFTFHNGVFGNTSNGWAGTCQQHGGTGTLTDVTWAAVSNTGVRLTFQGTPVSGSTYFLSCNGAVSGAN